MPLKASWTIGPVVEQWCRAIEDAGRTLPLQWIVYNPGISVNEFVVFLAASAHHHEDPSIVVRRFVDTRLLLRHTFRQRHPEPCIALESLSSPISSRKCIWADGFLHPRLRCDCSFTRTTLHLVNTVADRHCACCGAVEHWYYILFSCGDYRECRLTLSISHRLAGQPHTTFEDQIFSTGTEHQHILTFSSVTMTWVEIAVSGRKLMKVVLLGFSLFASYLHFLCTSLFFRFFFKSRIKRGVFSSNILLFTILPAH